MATGHRQGEGGSRSSKLGTPGDAYRSTKALEVHGGQGLRNVAGQPQTLRVEGDRRPFGHALGGLKGGYETLGTILGILQRRWLLVSAMCLLGLTIALLTAARMRPRYIASATLVINSERPRVLDDVRGVNDWDADVLSYAQFNATQRAILSSRVIAERVIEALKLGDNPEFFAVEHIEDELEQKRKIAGLDPTEQLHRYLAVRSVPNSHVVQVSVQYPRAELASAIANQLVDAYVEHIGRGQEDTGSRARNDLAQERKAAAERLRQAEQALDAFKQAHEITSISLDDRQNLITQNILSLSTQVNRAQAERIELAAMWQQVQSLREKAGPAAALALLPAEERKLVDALNSERLKAERDFAAARVDYLEKHPKYQRARLRLDLAERRLREQTAELLLSVEARLAAARQSEQRLRRALEGHRRRALDLARLEPEFRELSRNVQSASETFLLLVRRDSEIDVSNRVEHNPIEVLDRATPPRQADNLYRYLVIAAGLLAGLTAGFIGALLADRRDHRIRGRADLERAVVHYGLAVLGELPQLAADPRLGAANMRAQRRQRDLHSHLFPQSMMAERCRSVRAAVSFALPAKDSIAVLVTSPSSAEGKSSTAMNLALSYCQAHKSVVLVDADMRRPRLHQVFPPPVGQESYGLATVIEGTCDIDAALLRDLEGAPERLSVLPCGDLPENPAELLESAQARRVFAQLRERFDVIIIDSPPLLPVVDPLILSPVADGVVLVARSEATTREELAIALEHLRRRDTYVLGIVLNEVEGRGRKNGYGSAYYTYSSRRPEASGQALPAGSEQDDTIKT